MSKTCVRSRMHSGNNAMPDRAMDSAGSKAPKLPPLEIDEQGSFAVGGTVVRHPGIYDPTHAAAPDGQTLHGDHAHVFYQVPVGARRFPLVFLHGNAQFSKTWQTTPDGREGFQNIFLRRRFSVYLVDQPRRGGAGRSTVPGTIAAVPDDQACFDRFRIGIWPDYFPGVQFPRGQEALNQYFRQTTPQTGPFDAGVASDGVAALFDKLGPAIRVSHSQGGGVGWLTAIKSTRVRAIVSYEPGSGFPFPDGEVPEPIPSSAGPLHALGVPMADFLRLTKIPIAIFYGDNIPAAPSPILGQDNWRIRLVMAQRWAAAVNRHGGDATVISLPALGIRGNTHFPFSDLNNVEIADQMSNFLQAKGLD